MSKTADARTELLALQADILKRMKADMRHLLEGDSREIKKYYHLYKKEFLQIEAYSNKEELLEEVRRASIVFCGDFHTLRQSQKTPIRILREVVKKRAPLILGLEMICQRDQPALDAYQAGAIHEKEFLQRIRYGETWGFSWYNYRELLDFSRKVGIRVVGLNTELPKGKGVLEQREACAALRIAQEHLLYPDHLFFVLFGDLHVARPNLPAKTAKVLRSLGLPNDFLLIYQNSEQIYWRLAQEGKEQEVDVVRLGPKRYCVMSTPPWIMFQSYLSWVEGQGELLSDFQEEEVEPGRDYYHHLLELVQTIAIYFKLPAERMSDFSVYTPDDVEFVRLFEEWLEAVGPAYGQVVKSELVEEGSCLLSDRHTVCLSDISITRASEKAAQLAYLLSAEGVASEWQGETVENFYRRVFLETLGYLGSKVINYKRKCDLLGDYAEFIETHQGKSLPENLRLIREVAHRVLQHSVLEKKRCEGKRSRLPQRLYPRRPAVYLRFSRALGQMLGEKIYDALIQGVADKETVRKLFFLRFDREHSAIDTYFALAEQFQEVKPLFQKKSDIF